MKFPFVLRSRYDADVADLNADRDRLRHERDTAIEQRDTAKYNRGQALRQNASLDSANRRLHGRNLELGKRISKLTEADPTYTASLESRLARALTACRRYRASLTAETRRADHLQKRLDDALGLNTSKVLDGRHWQYTRGDGARKGAVL